jgi:hypothetical protein
MIKKLVILCVLIGASCFGAHGFSQEWKFDRPVIGTYTESALPSNASPGAIARARRCEIRQTLESDLGRGLTVILDILLSMRCRNVDREYRRAGGI